MYYLYSVIQHPSICEFPSSQFYKGKLVAAKEVWERRWPPSDIGTQRCAFIHVEGIEDVSGIDAKGSYEESKFNETEADKVVSYCNKSVQLIAR